MVSTRWERVRDLFRAAVTLAPPERAAFLATACADDGGLRREVESLLGALDGAGSLAETPAAGLVGPAGPDPLIGRRLGPYRVLAEIGRGGMGTVYVAVRDDDLFHKDVALKVLQGGLTTEYHRECFRLERQILATVTHANVAQLLDGGTTEDGRPYIVMELVTGEPIDAYCDRHALGVAQRIELFVAVCAAVDCAHQSLVVHRDIKPRNILVTAQGVPKLLDFGIARLLPPAGEAATVTVVRALTPLYASPEQLLGKPITTASDVYSLGVVLYELLAGRRPFEPADGPTEELVRRICHDEAARPSAVARERTASLADTAALAPGTDVPLPPDEGATGRRRRELRGDLDTIVMTALAKEPARRYASAAALADDLRRYLAGRPIAARKPTLAYRAGKFLRRHPAGVGAAVLVAALAAAFVVSTVRQSARVARERDKAERIASFMVGLFKVADPGEARGNTVTAREVLDRGSERISRELTDQPDVRATLLGTMGSVYESLGLYDRSAELLAEAVRVRREAQGPAHPDTARALSAFGASLVGKGDYAQAESVLRQALAAQEPGEAAAGDRAQTLHYLGATRYASGDYDEAARRFGEALAGRREAFGPRDERVATTLNNLANVLYEKGEYARAEPLYREALGIFRERLGDSHPRVALALHNLAGVLAAEGDYDGAESLHREAVELRMRVLGPDHPVLAGSEVSLALTLMGKGDFAGAEPLLRHALEVQGKRLGAGHTDAAFTRTALGQVRYVRGDYDEAESLYREALAAQRELGAHPDASETLTGLGVVLDQRGDTRGSLACLREALEERRRQFGDRHIYVSLTLLALGATLRHAGDLAAAEAAYREAVGIDRALGGEHPNLVESLAGLAATLLAQGRAAEGEAPAREAAALAGRRYRPGDFRRAIAESVLGEYLLATGRAGEAEPLLAGAYGSLRATLGEGNRETRDAGRRVKELAEAGRRAASRGPR